MRGGVVALLLLAALTIGAAPASARVYRGVMTNGAGAVRFFKLGRTLSAWRFTVRSEDA